MVDENVEVLPEETQSLPQEQETQSDILPEEAQSLPQEAKQIFTAAFNAAVSDGLSEGGARDVAWNSVKNTFRQDESGQWYFKAEDIKLNSPTGTMPGA